MSMITQIKADQIAARKAYDATTALLLTTLLGEAQAVGKNTGNREPTDSEVIAIIKKFIKNTDEFISALSKSTTDGGMVQIARLQDERNILENYLPKQMTEAEIETALHAAIGEVGSNMGKVMGIMKTKYAGLYDGQVVSTILKTLL